ncbi:MAG TPA: hypothetical protein VK203_03370 [Nostocaceae cyanobacterium]|nr:hypothetical protein [Nostocaceae cyanobacterium]
MQGKILPWLTLIVAIISVGFNLTSVNAAEEKPGEVRVEYGWKMTVIGEVISLRRVNISKFRDRPKYNVEIQMKVESFNDYGAGVKFKSPILLQGREKEVLKSLGRLPKVRERLVVVSFGVDKQTALLGIDDIKFAPKKRDRLRNAR